MIVPTTSETLLIEALDDYAEHQAWRCGHPRRYRLGVDCACGLHDWRRRAIAALGLDPCPACHGAGATPTAGDDDGWAPCDTCKGLGR
jgi:hypothetical protein